MIVELALALRGGVLAGATRNSLVAVLADAGDRTDNPKPRKLSGPVYKKFTTDDCANLAEKVSAILKIKPFACQQTWPKQRQLDSILKRGNID